jgi:hypothetical protein
MIVGAGVATIAGTGFQSGDTVIVDGTRVDATLVAAANGWLIGSSSSRVLEEVLC